MMDTRDIALGYQANFVTVALVCLVNCLKNQGALGARQYEGALRATIEAGGPDRERLDYQLLAILLATLEKQEPGQPPKLDAVH
jgi:hypothetical protein